jgi:hypothetical protein
VRTPLIPLSILILAAAHPALATEPQPVRATLTLRNHRFTPDILAAPAGTKILITLVNEDAASEEFDSDDLKVEEDVTPKATIRFVIKPLSPGRYGFQGEGHPLTAQGQILVSAPSSTAVGETVR